MGVGSAKEALSTQPALLRKFGKPFDLSTDLFAEKSLGYSHRASDVLQFDSTSLVVSYHFPTIFSYLPATYGSVRPSQVKRVHPKIYLRFRQNFSTAMHNQKALFLHGLEQQVDKYMLKLEHLFGQRDGRFEFGEIGRSTHPEGDPQTIFPYGYHVNGGCVVDIHLSHSAYDGNSLEQSIWQVAHECVHLLDPCCKGLATVLEEGLATWFQDEQKFHPDSVKVYIRNNPPHPPNYTEAKQLVAQCMPDLLYAVKKVRTSGIRLTDLVSEDLAGYLPKSSSSTIHRLCETFPL